MRIILLCIFYFFVLLIICENIIRFLVIQIIKAKRLLYIVTKRRNLFKNSYGKKLKGKRTKNNGSVSLLWLKIRYFILGVTFSFLFLIIPVAMVIFLQDLPSPHELTFRQIPQTTKIYDRHGQLLAELYSTQNRTQIHLSDVPVYLQDATIAIEDKNFYKHPGFDIPSIIRAFLEDIRGRHIQGGSTITQQLIKSSILTPEQNVSRKLKEIVLAFWAERIYTKRQILEMYFNQVPYGGTAWGVEAAAETYFGKQVKELDLAESTFLAGLTAAPTFYSPYGTNPTLWKQRQKEVLEHLVTLHSVSQKQADDAVAEQLSFRPQHIALHAPHFVQYVKELLIKKYGIAEIEKGGLTVYTSLDLNIQTFAEDAVKNEIDKDGYLQISNGAALVTNPKTGDILAMVGSKDFNNPNDGNVNIATSLRQPGSSIKVITYSAALSHGFTAATMLEDSPINFGGYTPVNYDGSFHGPISLRIALANSLNIPAVKVLNSVGVPTMVDLAKQMGIESWNDPSYYGLSITLGAADVTMLDMARVNGTLANNGKVIPLNPFLKVITPHGTILEERNKPIGKQILNPAISYIVSNILADNQARSMEFGPNSPLYIPNHFVPVKTGTSDNKRDNWTNGYTDKYVVIVWVGNNDNSPMSQALASGITGAAPIWHNIMLNLVTKDPEKKPIQPMGVIGRQCYGRIEYFLKDTENSANCQQIPPITPGVSKIVEQEKYSENINNNF